MCGDCEEVEEGLTEVTGKAVVPDQLDFDFIICVN